MNSGFQSSMEVGLEPGNMAIIGGTGFEKLPPDLFAETVQVETTAGIVQVLSVSNNYVEPYKLYFISRHGASHGLAPHQINYAANIEALSALEVKHILATNAVGALRTTMQPGELVLFDDFIDFTRSRPLTYFASGSPWVHTDFTEPYSLNLRASILKAASDMNLPIHSRCTYLCADGPRFESPAEVRLFAAWGADVVGMTGLPEVVFAREAGINYAAVGIITNLAAGLARGPVSHNEVVSVTDRQLPVVRELLLQTCALIRRQQDF